MNFSSVIGRHSWARINQGQATKLDGNEGNQEWVVPRSVAELKIISIRENKNGCHANQRNPGYRNTVKPKPEAGHKTGYVIQSEGMQIGHTMRRRIFIHSSTGSYPLVLPAYTIGAVFTLWEPFHAERIAA